MFSANIIAQNPSWIIAPKYYNQYFNPPILSNLPIPSTNNNSSNPMDGYDGQPAERSQNIQTDINGNILFFTVDDYIYDRFGRFIDMFVGEFSDNLGSSSVDGIAEMLIVPVPGDCKSYYLIAGSLFAYLTPGSEANAEVFYAKLSIDYCLDGSIKPGAGIDQNIGVVNLFSSGNFTTDAADHSKNVSLAVTKLNTNNERLLFACHESLTHVFKISASGITFTNQTLVSGSIDGHSSNRTEMEVASLPNGNYRLAYIQDRVSTTTLSQQANIINVFDVSATGALIPNSNKTIAYTFPNTASESIIPSIYGLEFTNDGNKLFVTHNASTNNPNTIDIVDLSSAQYTIQALNLTGMSDFKYSQIELNKNNEMVFATSNRLAKIINPDQPFASSNWNNNFQALSNYHLSNLFPTMPLENQKAYLLNDQIDGEDYSTNFAQNETCCRDFSEFDKESFTALTSVTWLPNNTSTGASNPLTISANSDVYIKYNIFIPKGKVITIKNMTIHFAANARLIIENGDGTTNGGRLVLDNSTLTSDTRCTKKTMWLGVEVWGNNLMSQGSIGNSKQGTLQLLNNSKISNAMIGVLLSRRVSNVISPTCSVNISYTGAYNDTYNGGIVSSNNSSLDDNQIGVYFRKYLYNGMNNLSGFYNSTFNWHSTLANLFINVKYHAQLSEVHGVKFYGCDFTNSLINNLSYTAHGIGIYANNAHFFVRAYSTFYPQPNPDRGTFKNLHYGIIAQNGGIQSFECDKNDFSNCRYGISVNSVNYEKITSNTFKVKYSNNYQTAGIVLYSSTGYKVEENDLDYFANAGTIPASASYGITVTNSQTLHNEIYKNRFKNLQVGGYSEGVNGILIDDLSNPDPVGTDPLNPTTKTMRGLQWLCNDFNKTIAHADLQVVSGQIDYHQGYTTTSSALDAMSHSARNDFSDVNIPSKFEFEISPTAQKIEYVHLSDFNHVPHNYSLDKIYAAPARDQFNNLVYSNTNTCPSKLGDVTVPKLVIADYTSKINELLSKIDGGNTAQLLAQVNSMTDMDALKNLLLSYSPYLSDEVLLAYIARNPSNGLLKQVLMANSQLSETVKKSVANLSLPNGVKNQINSVQKGVSARTSLINETLYLRDQITYIKNEMIRNALLNSDDNADLEQLILVLKDLNDFASIKMLLDTYIYKGDMVKEQETRSAIVTSPQEIYVDEFIQLTEVERDIRFVESTDKALTDAPNQKDKLIHLRDNASDIHISNRAKTILSLLESEMEVNDFLLINNGGTRKSVIVDESSPEINESIKLFTTTIYPNPTSSSIYLEYAIQEEGEVKVQIVDLSGKIMIETTNNPSTINQIDLSSLNKGLYIVKINVNDKLLEVQKIHLK